MMTLFQPFEKKRYNLLVGALAFLLGAYFDLTKYRLDPAWALAGSGPFLLAARLLGGLIAALLVLALLKSGRELLGLGKVSGRQMLLLFLGLNAVTAIYVLTSSTVYVWDNAGYWMTARNLAEGYLGRQQLFEVLKSTVHQDYNALLAYPISLMMRVFGGSRAVFLFSISNLYTLPALWGLCALCRDKKWGGLTLWGLFPMLTYIGLVGYVDVAACGLAIWAYVIYTSDRPSVSRGILTGALLVAAFLLRRYFFFFAASFGVAALVEKLFFDRKRWGDFLALFFSCGVFSLYLTPNFLLSKVLGTDYGDLYSAYDLGLASDWKLVGRYFGLSLLSFLLVWTFYQLRREENRRERVFALVQGGVCALAFLAVQSHGQQHLLLYVPALALLVARMLEEGPPKARWAGLAVGGLVFAWCFVPKAQPASIGEIKGVPSVPSITFYGPKRSDIVELTELCDYVDGLSAQGEKTAVVLASSFTLNDETLRNLRPSLNLPQPEVKTTIRYHGTVDKRDPFNWNTLTADYLVVGDPIQTHLGEENQQVMALFAQDVLVGEGPGTAYEALPVSFLLENGCTARIFARTRNLTGEEYRDIAARLQGLYPDYAQHYAVPDWVE